MCLGRSVHTCKVLIVYCQLMSLKMSVRSVHLYLLGKARPLKEAYVPDQADQRSILHFLF